MSENQDTNKITNAEIREESEVREEINPGRKAIATTPHSLTPELTKGFEIQVTERKQRIEEFNKFVKEELIEGEDYGTIPGVKKPSLWKGGAEKINNYRALFPHYTIIEKTRDFQNGFFDYWTKCTLYKVVFFEGKSIEIQVAEGEGTCNSMESKYRFNWAFKNNVPEDVDINSLQKKTIITKTGAKIPMYKIVNADPFSLDNTIRKMSNKRAYLAATLTATPGASVIFTQDLEDNAKPKKESKKTFANPIPLPKENGTDADRTYSEVSAKRAALNAKLIHLKERVGSEMYKEAINVIYGGKTKLTLEEMEILVKHLEKVDLDNMGKQDLGA